MAVATKKGKRAQRRKPPAKTPRRRKSTGPAPIADVVADATKALTNGQAATPANGKPVDDKPPVLSLDEATDSLKQIAAAERVVKECESVLLMKKSDAKEAKERLGKALEKLHRIIREVTGNEPNLFNGAAKAATAPPPEEDWRKVPITSLNLTTGVEKNLNAANIHTMGDLVDYTDPNKHGGKQQRITDIKGIGESAAGVIEAATTQFWEERSKTSVPAEATVDSTDDEKDEDDDKDDDEDE